MIGIVWVVLALLAAVWLLCCLGIAVLATAAHRGDPRVIAQDPCRPEDDFARWELEQHDLRPREGARAAWV